MFHFNNNQFFKNLSSDEVITRKFLRIQAADDFANFSSFEAVDWWYELRGISRSWISASSYSGSFSDG
jgi:hypothetical protein